MHGYKEIRKMEMCSLRGLCIRMNWYTDGDIDEYDNLLRTADRCENITTDVLVELATDIRSHSNTDHEITTIMYELADICYTYFEEV